MKDVNNKKNSKTKVAVGLSGGVDSSVAAYLLKEQGYDVTGVYMLCWEKKADGCIADEDRAYAVQSAASVGIRFESLDFKKEYEKKVISYFYDEYKAGRTPNPDVMCNKEIKFGLFFDWAMKNGFDFVATGHYAGICCSKPGKTPEISASQKSHNCQLLKGKDKSKDQSYFLYLMDQEHLRKTLFPLSKMTKKEVRNLAKKVQLPSANRPESQGICFIGEVDIREFLARRIKPKKGKVKLINGEFIGNHEGAWFYTIGQRHGFTIDKYVGKPLYVVAKNINENTLTVGFEKDVYKDNFTVEKTHWIYSNPFNKTKEKSIKCKVRIRHLGDCHECKMEKDVVSDMYKVILKKPVFGVAPGQSAVFYKGEEVLGGGIISS